MVYIGKISSPSSAWKKKTQSWDAWCWKRTHQTTSHHFSEIAVESLQVTCCSCQGFCLWESCSNSFSQINFFQRRNQIRKEASYNEHHTNRFWIAERRAGNRNSNCFVSSLTDPDFSHHYHVILRCTIHIPLMGIHLKDQEVPQDQWVITLKWFRIWQSLSDCTPMYRQNEQLLQFWHKRGFLAQYSIQKLATLCFMDHQVKLFCLCSGTFWTYNLQLNLKAWSMRTCVQYECKHEASQHDMSMITQNYNKRNN